ncbi:MAG TPA: hypothetical protein VHV26_03805 [Rhizomicrobium sp.]|jgi:hypothetical protein|nr:hypothetical protein [Rhizomicrobium sp.]
MIAQKKFKLTIDLTPNFMSEYALRKHVSDHRWRKIIKKGLITARGLACEICDFSTNETSHIDAHEVFEYLADDTVWLADIQLLCTRCHDIKDFAQTERLIAEGVKPSERRQLVLNHFCRVNECTLSEFNEHYDEGRRYVRAIERRYGPNIAHERVHYGAYHGHFLKAKDRARLNKSTAAQMAVTDAIRSGVHEDYREDVLDIARNDELFAEELLLRVKAGDSEAARSLIAEALAEYFDDDSIITDDEVIYWFREPNSA